MRIAFGSSVPTGHAGAGIADTPPATAAYVYVFLSAYTHTHMHTHTHTHTHTQMLVCVRMDTPPHIHTPVSQLHPRAALQRRPWPAKHPHPSTLRFRPHPAPSRTFCLRVPVCVGVCYTLRFRRRPSLTQTLPASLCLYIYIYIIRYILYYI